MSYADFTKAANLPGLLFKDGKVGSGSTPEPGDRVVIDWTGYTIGYFGRPFETKKLKELDAKDDAFLRFEVGAGTLIPAIEKGVIGMSEGGVRQLVVPPAVGYPSSDPSHEKVGPKPSTFSGQRALDFVLRARSAVLAPGRPAVRTHAHASCVVCLVARRRETRAHRQNAALQREADPRR